jgi:ligand-binding sensor domain-containing protein
MRAREVTALLPLGSERLLMGTAKLGLLVYDGKTLERFHATTNDINFTALAGSEAELWIGTLESGVLDWGSGEVTALSEAQGLPDRRVDAISVANGAVYVGTPAGVAEIRAGT